VRRAGLDDRLGPDTGASWTLVVGPPGAGKSTLVRTWIDSRTEPWTWVGITSADVSRPNIADLLARAIQRARPDRPLDLLDALEMDVGEPLWIPAQLVEELSADGPGAPMLIVVDDAHILSSDDWRLLGWFLENVPSTVHPVIISRSEPPVPLGRQRAQGRLTEVRQQDLAFGLDETRQLLESASVDATPELVRALQTRTEGWVAGIRLAALAINDGADPGELLDRFSVTTTSVAEFLVEEVLDRQSEHRRDFLAAVAVLHTLEPEICDAVSGRSDSASVLRTVAADGIFVTPVGQGADEYRFHPLLAELLRHEQVRRDPDAARRHHRRAAGWLVEHGRGIEAIEHLLAAGDHAQAQDLVLSSFPALYVGPHRRDLDLWLAAIPDEVIAESVDRAMDHCVALTLIANPDGPRWWEFCSARLAADDVWLQSRLECVLAVYDAVNARADSMRTHWANARRLRPVGRVEPLDEVIAHWDVRIEGQLGDPHRAVELGRSLVSAPRSLVPDASALSVLAGALEAAGQTDSASAVAARAIERWQADGEPELPGMVDALVVAARTARRLADLDTAERLVELATLLPPPRPGAHLLLSIALIERARIDHARGGSAWRPALLSLAEELRVAGSGTGLAEWVDRARRDIETEAVGSRRLPGPPPAKRQPDPGHLVQPLTQREITILRLLASHLSLPEIGVELHISRHTVKSHVGRIYGKLGTTSRSGAVRIAREVGILD
jgi:LuxR family maltose regulon positive regulatory protein